MKNKAQEIELDLSNVVEFPLAEDATFKRLMRVHMNNLFLSFGKEQVIEYIKETQGLEEKKEGTNWLGGRAA